MWSSASHYSSTPHLFVYQPCDENIDDVDYGETEPTSSDSGYADSMRSAESASSSSAGPEPIYYSASEFSQCQRSHWVFILASVSITYFSLHYVYVAMLLYSITRYRVGRRRKQNPAAATTANTTETCKSTSWREQRCI